ncbi:hypothetical protein ON010_g16451 [Phytophthora cinnamomi]|nr:hypothetical protein ON010_g16451 [Phytophthora cinnamomi]
MPHSAAYLTEVIALCSVRAELRSEGKKREDSVGHGRGAREGRVGHDVHALIRAERRVRQLRAELERRVGVVP